MPLAYGLIHPVDLALADLPPSLQGLRIAHLSDLHVRYHSPRHDRLTSQLTSLRLDLMLFTGDYMTREHEATEAAAVLRRIREAVRPKYGAFGVFGNHDSPELLDMVRDIGITWLGTGTRRVPGAPIHFYSVDPLDDAAEDGVAMLLNGQPLGGMLDADVDQGENEAEPGSEDCLRLMLAHYPSWFTTAGDLGVHMLFSGHTHGGQVRLPTGQPLLNACDLPLEMSCGVLRHRDTLIAISKGLGEVGFPGTRLRAFCPPHVPVYTLRRGPTLGQNTAGLVKVVGW